jgi:hypothetical protein
MKFVRTFEEFELPLGRTENTKNLALDTFLDLEDIYSGVKVSFRNYSFHGLKSSENYNQIEIRIPETLSKNEIHEFYDKILIKKIEFLESKGLKFISESLLGRLFDYGTYYKKIWFKRNDSYTDIDLVLKKH